MKKQTNSTSNFWLGIFALCFFLFQLISYKIRPAYDGDNEIVNYFLGVAPNFFPSIGIPALIYAILETNKSKNSAFVNRNAFLIALCVGVSGLILWEILQIYSKKLSFYWHDILWTIAGGLIFWLIGQKLKRKM